MSLADLNVLPDSRAAEPKGLVQSALGWMEPIYCISCGVFEGSYVYGDITSVMWMCNACFAKHGEQTAKDAGLWVMPDQVFWETVRVAQEEKYGRQLTQPEIENNLHDPNSLESLLLRERKILTPAGSF